ncbi:MAG TPA: C45 family autoproteolytic acyltransferase/hydrolase [Gemmataceae bacterium]|nr:C45 family autoproteolytic acyltransferase/hydrolase [Gemmataceae bacterium]
MRRLSVLVLSIISCLPAVAAQGAAPTPPDFQPDARAVQRYGPAYRYPQSGWIVLHIEGEPYERGVQHGRLLAPEIAAQVRCLAERQSPKSPADGWKQTRTLVNSLFLRRYDKEYLEEMKGIADGAAAAGARFDDRPIDLVDIVGINAWAELMTLDDGLDAEPTGLECLRCQEPGANPPGSPAAHPPKPERCSSFAAVGPATADGKIVFGHITMYNLYESSFFNVWLDVKNAKGHRVLMQSYPGGIQSGLDYYLNDAGILCAETTIAQTRFDPAGLAEASRIRKALQYADTIDKAVEVLKEQNNGLYTNEWMLADVKTNEIAMFELGTKKSKLYRSSKNEWYGGTEGFYWGCNNTKDLEVRLETIDDPAVGRPGNPVFHPSDRDRKWLELYDKYKGKIDADFGKLAFTTPPIAAFHSVDAKFTTSDMAKELKTWALFGPPLGRTWKPTEEEQKKFPEIEPLVGNPWVVLNANPPPGANAPGSPIAVDLHDPATDTLSADPPKPWRAPETDAAWHGTLLPKTDADDWLASGFHDYERIVALENAFRKRATTKGGPAAVPGFALLPYIDQQQVYAVINDMSPEDRDALAVALYAYRAEYNLGARAHPEATLNDTRSDVRQDDWYRVASGKGVLLLNDVRNYDGSLKFGELMERFGAEHGGKPTAVADLAKMLRESSGLDTAADRDLLEWWTTQPGLPRYKLGKVSVKKADKGYNLEIGLHVEGCACERAVDVVVETEKGEVVRRAKASAAADAKVRIEVNDKPLRVVVDKYNLASKANGGAFTTVTFKEEPENTMIVYGTADEANVNREAAEALQQAIRANHCNITVPIRTDREVTDDDLKTHHLLVIGRPGSNTLTAKVASDLPISFGQQSFEVRGEWYAHADSAVIAAAENPLNRRFSLVVIAGLNAASTLRTAPKLLDLTAAEVVVLPHGKPARALTVPAKDLIADLHAVHDGK